MRSLLRPRWIAGHLLAVAAVVSFVLLGMWQLRRHDEKLALRDSVEQAMAGPSLPLQSVPEGSFAMVTAAGRFDADLEAKVLRSRGGVSGYEVLTPLVLDDGNALLVDRGWVALDVDYLAAGGNPPTEVLVEGILWPPQEGSGIPDEFPEFVRRVDPEIQQAFAGYDLRREFLVVTRSDPPPPGVMVYPEVGQVSLGPHLGYAGQWFLFAAVVIVGYPLLLRKRWGP